MTFLCLQAENRALQADKRELVERLEQKQAELESKNASTKARPACASNPHMPQRRAPSVFLTVCSPSSTFFPSLNPPFPAVSAQPAQTYLDRTIALTEERGEMEAKVREALAERASADLARARLEQEKQLLEQHNKWLADELAAKAEALLAERRRSSAEEEGLRNRLSEARRP